MDSKSTSCIDFDRAVLDWETIEASRGRWRVIASAAQSMAATVEETRFVLTPMVMAGDVYGRGKLPLSPAFSYQFAASTSRHIIFRDYGDQSAPRDTADNNNQLFSSLKLDLPQRQVRTVNPQDLTAKSPGKNWPLFARISIPQAGERSWVLEFPVNHISTRSKQGRLEFQVETGPVLIPQEHAGPSGSKTVGDFVLAYIFFTRLDRADLALFSSATKTANFPRSFSRYQRLDNIEITLLAAL